MNPVHLDASYLIRSLADRQEWRKLEELAGGERPIRMSAIAWYEFCRGPRTPQQIAVARSFLLEEGVVPFTEEIAEVAAAVFRRLGSPRARAADIAIGTTAIAHHATLLTRNPADFQAIAGLRFEE
ncbi:MAG: type II toxin-antitoxin system VapC family toxin [Armatimonadetes bacterium]|nr:type II toxin-antitoxin system VapC family toxin [Armatimonadota bacterium]